ncbi:MAG: hypothetical protein ACC657_01675, partial [Thiohalomonadales bacterium]
MKKNTLSILLIIIAILVTISIYITNNSESNRSEDQSTGQKILPKLYDQLNDVTSIKITNSTGNIIINKSDNADIGWTVKTKDNYPGNVVQIRKTLIDLAELEKVEAKTKKDKNYAKLGVQALTD